jgi:4-alpha-glucanotransferase
VQSVWCNQSKFKLNEDGSPRVVAGVPPDYFSSTGQLWGNPIYDWDAMRADGFSWWVERVKLNLRLVDIIRIDHFIGLGRAYEVPGGSLTAENGEWVSVPGTDLFNAFKEELGDLPFIAEDLGEVTREVEELRDAFGVAPMRVLQFAFGGDAHNIHLPHNHVPHSVVYTATHDNQTTVGWYKSGMKPRKQPHIKHCLKYLKSSGKEINWDMIAAAFASVSETAIVPMQDVLGLDDSARMNTPATMGNNWSWRMTEEQFNTADFTRLRELSEFYAR